MAEGLDVGTLSGRIEFEDHVSSVMDLIAQKVVAMEGRFDSLGHHVADTAAGFALGAIAIGAFKEAVHLGTEAIKDMSVQGAAIADVEANFDHLNAGAQRLGSTLLTALREGTHNTITNFELMKIANTDLAAGMNLTDAQFKTIATGGFALAQAKAIDVKTAFDAINEGMLTGNVRALKALGIRIDQAKAETDYAEKLGTTSDRLSEEGKLEATREAILSKVGASMDRLGEQTDGLDELIAQARTSWANFYEDLSKTVATSPHVIGAFTTIRDSLVGAFGGDTSSMLETVVGWINTVADTTTEMAPKVIEGFKTIKEWVVGFYHGAVEAWTDYGPVIIGGFMKIEEWVLDVYHTVVDTWNALPEWLKTVAERTALTAAGLYIVGSAVEGTTSAVGDLVGMAGNLTTTFSGLPNALANIAGALGSVKLLAGLTTLEFTSMAAASASVSLLGGAILGMIGPLGVAAIAAGAMYAAFELGKWQPISNFFEKWSLVLMGYSRAQADAMVATDNLTQAAAGQSKVTDEQATAQAKINEMLAQMKAAHDAAGAAAGSHADNEKRLHDVVEMTVDELKKFRESWTNLNSLGSTFEATLEGVDEKVRGSIVYYAKMGASVDDLVSAFPKLTKAQAEAAVQSVKSANDIRKTWDETFDVITKSQGNNINRWIEGEHRKLASTLEALQISGQLTQAQLDAEMAKFDAVVNAEIKGREEQNQFSKAHYEKEVEDAQNAYDLMIKASDDHTTAEIRNAYQELIEKKRTLEHWAAAANEAYENHTHVVDAETGKQVKAVDRVGDAWGRIPAKVAQLEATMMRLDGVIETLTQRAARLNQGSSMTYDLTSTQGLQQFHSLNPGASSTYSDQQLMYAAQHGATLQSLIQQGIINLYGKGMPGFAEGGVGDFGSGTMAMLHGKEAVIPLDKAGIGAGTVNIFINDTLENAAYKVADVLMKRAYTARAF
jgi:hypothetical protein